VLSQTIAREVAKRVVSQDLWSSACLTACSRAGMSCSKACPARQDASGAHKVAECLRIAFSRIQFTPDLLPADVIGTMVFDQKTQEFLSEEGAAVSRNLVLADEINRAPPRWQAALLEANAGEAGDGSAGRRSSGRAVSRARDPEPHRAGGDLPAARGTARSVHAQGARRLPERRDAEKEIVARIGLRTTIEVQRVAEADDILARRSAIAELFMIRRW